MNMILSLMSLWHGPSTYICWADHFFYDLFQDVSYLPNLFGLTLIRNQSDLCTQLFVQKSATWRAIYVYFMTCILIINEFRQVFYLFENPRFWGIFFPLSPFLLQHLNLKFFYIILFFFFWWSYLFPKLICLNMTNQFTVTSYFYYQQLL